MKKEDKHEFLAQFKELSTMLSWVRDHLSPLVMSKTDQRKIELAVEEALVNVIRYAYPTSQGKVTILYDQSSNGEVSFTIQDHGAPFNPAEKIQKIDKEAPIEEREPGGLGIFFMFEIMDEVGYQRVDGQNILTLKKFF